jgi:uncharacterized repeat protein (TIGR03803 family)
MNHRRLLTFVTLTAMACLGFSARAGASNSAISLVYSFSNGMSPDAGVVLGRNGSFYGVTSTGGPGNDGGIFEVTSNGVLTNLIWLNGTDGAMPLAPLIQDGSGNFYGTASSGGVNNNGTIFQFTSAGQFRLLASFENTNGATPLAPLLAGTNGWFYGTTFNGGSNNLGAIFGINIAAGGVLTNVFSFAGTDGANPAAGLIQGTDGNLYGTTAYGGANGLGTVFKLTYAGALTTVCSFANENGAFPGALIEDTNLSFYGTAINGGPDFAGTIFKLTSASNLQTIATFGITNGSDPNSPLTLGNDGVWYGTTEEGGAYGQGTIFRLDPEGFLTGLVSFAGTNGAWPRSSMVQGTNGNFYGTTTAGGAYGYGEIYQLGVPPFIIRPPASQPFASNATAQFTVSAGGSTPLSYQWLFDGTNTIPDATNASLVVTKERRGRPKRGRSQHHYRSGARDGEQLLADHLRHGRRAYRHRQGVLSIGRQRLVPRFGRHQMADQRHFAARRQHLPGGKP